MRFYLTITDIAKLAGVSISTVSKIINNKDAHIAQKTRERVLAIVKKYRYSPYDFVQKNPVSKKFVIGVLFPQDELASEILKGITTHANAQGYHIQLCGFLENKDSLAQLRIFAADKVDLILWKPRTAPSQKTLAFLKKINTPYYLIDTPFLKETEFATINYNYEKLGFLLCQKLLLLNHTQIGYFSSTDNGIFIQHGVEQFIQGITHALLQKNKTLFRFDTIDSTIFQESCTAFICFGTANAFALYERAQKLQVAIPKKITLVCVDLHTSLQSNPFISTVNFDFSAFGNFIAKTAIGQLENFTSDIERAKIDTPLSKTTSSFFTPPFAVFMPHFSFTHEKTIAQRQSATVQKIIVAGSIHFDVFLTMDDFLQTGKTLRASDIIQLPGGKGVNQAVGIAKLNGNVALVGNIGKDYDGMAILDVLSKNNVDTSAVFIDPVNATGKAYIHVQSDGESSIVIYSGANQTINHTQIMQKKDIFINAAFFLLQTEIPFDIITILVHIAHEQQIPVMLKPSAIQKMPLALLSKITYFIPNHKELDILCPISGSLAEKSQWFLDQGVNTVIVTLDKDGCYLKTHDEEAYFSAFSPSEILDTTGAADAFIATLAVFLSEHVSLKTALSYACYAAGFSTKTIGGAQSFIDRKNLEKFIYSLK